MSRVTRFVMLILTVIFFTGCKKNDQALTIQLYDQPLTVIQQNITGKWKLLYISGGVTGGRTDDNNNTIMTLDSNHIKITNNSGVGVDGPLTWVKIQYGSATTYTYQMEYKDLFNPVTYMYVVKGINNGVLDLLDRYTSESSHSYFSKAD